LTDANIPRQARLLKFVGVNHEIMPYQKPLIASPTVCELWHNLGRGGGGSISTAEFVLSPVFSEAASAGSVKKLAPKSVCLGR
jgi:hypothetical protein